MHNEKLKRKYIFVSKNDKFMVTEELCYNVNVADLQAIKNLQDLLVYFHQHGLHYQLLAHVAIDIKPVNYNEHIHFVVLIFPPCKQTKIEHYDGNYETGRPCAGFKWWSD